MLMNAALVSQALEWERMGPKVATPSPERRQRLAVQEGATALIATLLPAIEPVRHPWCWNALKTGRAPSQAKAIRKDNWFPVDACGSCTMAAVLMHG